MVHTGLEPVSSSMSSDHHGQPTFTGTNHPDQDRPLGDSDALFLIRAGSVFQEGATLPPSRFFVPVPLRESGPIVLKNPEEEDPMIASSTPPPLTPVRKAHPPLLIIVVVGTYNPDVVHDEILLNG